MTDFEVRTAHALFEIALSALFLSIAAPKCESGKRLCASYVCLVGLLPLFYTDTGILASVGRYAWRILIYFGFFYLRGGLSTARALALSTVSSTCFLVADNIMVNPVFYGLRIDNMPWFAIPALSDFILKCLLKYVAVALVLVPTFLLIPFKDMHRLSPERLGVLLTIVLVVVYTKEISYQLSESGIDVISVDFTAFMVLLNLLLLAFLVLMERAFASRVRSTEAAMREVVSEMRLTAFKERLTADEETRALRHDLKNHILALKQLAAESRDSRILNYLDSMEESSQAALRRFSTGSALLDGILSQKAKDAHDADVAFESELSAPVLKNMNDADLRSLFGNLLDNAIEAARQQPDARLRYVRVGMRTFANQLSIIVENGFSGEIRRRDGLPLTTKKGSTHGYGLRNVRLIARKYGGDMTLEHDGSVFKATVRLDVDQLRK